MNPKVSPMNRRVINRRAFLTGGGLVAVGLPFLEGMPTRSAWAQEAAPVFTFFVVAQNGVVGKNFFPSATGAGRYRGFRPAAGSGATNLGSVRNAAATSREKFTKRCPCGVSR